MKNPELICEINWGILLQLIYGILYEKTENNSANRGVFFCWVLCEDFTVKIKVD